MATLRGEVFTDMVALPEAVSEKVQRAQRQAVLQEGGLAARVLRAVSPPLLWPLPSLFTRSASGSTAARCRPTAMSPSNSSPLSSVSHLLVGRTMPTCAVTEPRLEDLPGRLRERVATHPLLPASARNRYSNQRRRNMPKGKSDQQLDAGRIRRWADRVGPSCREAVDRVYKLLRVPRSSRVQRLHRAAEALQQVLRGSRSSGPARCRSPRASARRGTATSSRCPRRARTSPPPTRAAPASAADGGGYVRGADFYGEG